MIDGWSLLRSKCGTGDTGTMTLRFVEQDVAEVDIIHANLDPECFSEDVEVWVTRGFTVLNRRRLTS